MGKVEISIPSDKDEALLSLNPPALGDMRQQHLPNGSYLVIDSPWYLVKCNSVIHA